MSFDHEAAVGIMMNLNTLTGAVLPAHDEAYVLETLDKACLDGAGRLQPMPADFYARWEQRQLMLWCVRRGFYCLPTNELVAQLRAWIDGRKAIEIGAGNGAIGRALGIVMTDSWQQRRPGIAAAYRAMGQETVPYADDVVELDAEAAVARYAPEVVIGAWVTHRYEPTAHERGGNYWGVDEGPIVDQVQTYISIGHDRVHQHKPLLEREHATFHGDFLFSRAQDSGNAVWVWRGGRS